MPRTDEQAEPKEARVSILMGGLMVGVAILFDIIQALLDLLGGLIPPLLIIPWFMSGVAFIVFFIWFKLLDVNYLDRNAAVKLLTMLVSAAAELIPFINMIPALTLGVVALVTISRFEDGKSLLVGFFALRHRNLGAEKRNVRAQWVSRRIVRDERSMASQRVTYEQEKRDARARGEQPESEQSRRARVFDMRRGPKDSASLRPREEFAPDPNQNG